MRNNTGKIKINKKTLLIIAVFMLAISCFSYIMYAKKTNLYPYHIQANSCQTKENIKLCLGTSKKNIKSGEKLIVKTTIYNSGDQTYNKSFSCTDVSPTILVNGKPLIGLCGLAITGIEIEAGNSVDFEEKLSINQFDQVENIISATWQGIETPEIKITKN